MTLVQNDNLVMRYSGGPFNEIPANSLGGAMSEFLVAGTLNALFAEALTPESTTGSVKYRWVYFTNLDPNASGLLAAKLFVSLQPPADVTFEVGLGTLNTPETMIDDEDTAPAGIAFSAPSSYAAGIALPTPFVQNDYIGIAVKRIVTAGAHYQDLLAKLVVSGTTS